MVEESKETKEMLLDEEPHSVIQATNKRLMLEQDFKRLKSL